VRYDLAALVRRERNPRRKSITLRDIVPPSTFSTNLYQRAYQPIIRHWEAAIPRIMASYIRTLASMTTDSPADIQAGIDGTADSFLRLLLELVPELSEWVLRTETWQRGKWRGAVLSTTGVDLATLLGPADVRETLQAVIARNTALMKDLSSQAQSRISDAVFRGLTERQPADDVAKELRDAVGLSRDRARRISSDQLQKLTSALADERQREAGIEQVEWRSSRKKHPRKHHEARNGKLFYLNSRKAVDGSETVEAGDWAGQPPYCGCRTFAHISFD
jgi:SPP1 gp7 family putative phage head morphogenesis protein